MKKDCHHKTEVERFNMLKTLVRDKPLLFHCVVTYESAFSQTSSSYFLNS